MNARRFVSCLSCFAALALPPLPSFGAALESAIAPILANPRAANGTFGIEIVDVDTGRVLYARNPIRS